MSIATLTSKGQTTIPKDVRDQVGLQPGDRMHFTVLESGAIVVRVKNRSARELRGVLKARKRVPVKDLSR